MLKGMNPELLPGVAFNMAHVKLRVVILGVSYISFGDDLESGNESWRISFYKKYYGLDIDRPFELKDHSNILRYGPYEALKMGLNNFQDDLLNGMQTNGWMRTEGFDSVNISDSFAFYRATIHNNSLKEKNVPRNILALQGILRMLEDKHIEVNMLMLPVMHNYYNALDPAWISRNDSIISTIHREFDFEFLNLTKADDNLYNTLKDGFNDVDHLNAKGVEALFRNK
jgi:hypothetical protein